MATSEFQSSIHQPDSKASPQMMQQSACCCSSMTRRVSSRAREVLHILLFLAVWQAAQTSNHPGAAAMEIQTEIWGNPHQRSHPQQLGEGEQQHDSMQTNDSSHDEASQQISPWPQGFYGRLRLRTLHQLLFPRVPLHCKHSNKYLLLYDTMMFALNVCIYSTTVHTGVS